jgi:CheY-like chemotaxis protein
MSHELRTPLNAVLGFSQVMLNSQDVTLEQMQNLNIITRSGQHLLDLINNVLDISKIEAGRVELEESPVDLHQLVQEIKSLMYARAREKGLTFVLEQSPDLPRHVNADGRKLRQVLINLVGNAVKYTASGEVLLCVRVIARETPQQVLARFEVQDTGPGIREEDRERIFLPFVQLGDRPTAEPGTGLGLTICRQYVQLMGGTIGVCGAPGKGSVFHFEIPLTVLPSEAAPAEPRRGRALALVPGQPRYRLLVTEDQPESRLLLHKFLEPLGFDLRDAVNGKEAITLFEQWHPDLVFMDIRMPVMDGLEATRHMRKAAPDVHTRIIALTAHALEEERREILAAGCDDFIRKPYEYADILDALEKHLGARFVYEEQAVSTPTPQRVSAAALAALPEELRCALEQAVVRIDINAINSAIETIRVHNPTLADALATAARDLQFGQILHWVRAARVQERKS